MMNPFQKPDPSAASFLPEEYVSSRAETRANLICLGLFAIVMFGVVAAFFVTNRRWETIRAEQRSITVRYTEQAQKIDQLKNLEKQRAQMLEKAEVTTALIEKVPRSLLLAELVTRMPADLTLVDVTLKSKRIDAPAPPGVTPAAPKVVSLTGASSAPPAAEPAKVRPPRFEFTLTIVGVAARNNDIADYLASLRDCPLLANVDLHFIKETTIEKVELRRFEIEATLRPDADARAIAATDPEAMKLAPATSVKNRTGISPSRNPRPEAAAGDQPEKRD